MSDDEQKPTRPRRARPNEEATRDDVDLAPAKRKRARRASTDAPTVERAKAGEDDATVEGAPVASREDVAAVASAAHAQSVGGPLLASAIAAAVGLAVVGTSASAIGPWVLAAGVVGLIASIHRLGRLGPA